MFHIQSIADSLEMEWQGNNATAFMFLSRSPSPLLQNNLAVFPIGLYSQSFPVLFIPSVFKVIPHVAVNVF